ncbi:RNA polymerase sigma factor [Streptomyces sp. NPDC002073]
MGVTLHTAPDREMGEGMMDSHDDERRFTAIYREHYRPVEAYVVRRIEPDGVTDIVAEVFLVAWRRFDDMPLDRALPWLYGVTKHVLANDRRARSRRASLGELLAAQPAALAGLSPHPEDVIALTDVAWAFDRLPEGDQEVLRLTLWENLEPSSAAQVLGCSAPTVRVRLFRARKRLRRLLQEPADRNPVHRRVQEGTRA